VKFSYGTMFIPDLIDIVSWSWTSWYDVSIFPNKIKKVGIQNSLCVSRQITFEIIRTNPKTEFSFGWRSGEPSIFHALYFYLYMTQFLVCRNDSDPSLPLITYSSQIGSVTYPSFVHHSHI
jgi:hypothetical protein